ncbi:MAG: hypothetical protein P4L22_07730 [Candidatus Babeliales bacterium]|nr:hypothetical protein [Candidatus Babeliales bacterium]
MKKNILMVALFCIVEFSLVSDVQPENTNANQEIAKKMVIANQLYNRNQKFNVRDTYIRRSRPQMQQLVAQPHMPHQQPQMSQQMPVVNQSNLQVQTCPTCKQNVNNNSVQPANNLAGHNQTMGFNQQVNNQQNVHQQANKTKFSGRKTVGFGHRKQRRFKYQ